MKLRVLDLFAGIGGFSLGLERTGGFETVAFCEIEKYPQKVLAKHWPGVKIYDDVRELTAERLASDGIGVDVITGGFPCQDISVAGKQAGIGEGTRSGLWSEVARLIGELRPRYAIMENVTALLSGGSGRWFGRVLGDLAEVGYDAEWHCIPASELGAHHHRDRVWIVAHPRCKRLQQRWGDPDASKESELAGRVFFDGPQEQQVEKREILADPERSRQSGQGQPVNAVNPEMPILGKAIESWDGSRPDIWRTEPNVGRVANGIPARSHRLKALGNAVVPQIPELIGRAILEANS